MIYTKEQCTSLHQEQFAYLIIEEKNHILNITLNRPQQRNALNEVLTRELAFAFSYAHHHHAIRVVILAAAGSVFCAGADLKTLMGQQDLDSGSSIPKESKDIILGDLFDSLHKPCIAKVGAPVYAGGFLLLAGCTHVFASESSSFTLSEVKRGIWPFQVMASLLKVMPERKVLDWCIQGKTWSLQEAYDAGLVTHLTSDNNLDIMANDLAASIAENAPTAIRLGLKAIQELKSIPKNEQHQFLYKKLMESLKTTDAQEGISAFREKRKANWTGE